MPSTGQGYPAKNKSKEKDTQHKKDVFMTQRWYIFCNKSTNTYNTKKISLYDTNMEHIMN